ncbi:MAG: two-component system alkaline phosphatase synthesis response regulator PhoP [Cellvibrionaceae bacterium]|jgi:two-component system alkaline phosphatase synthesis response regulator PhoP
MSRILVVDDDPNIVRLVRSYLEQAGFTVLTAGNGVLAQQMIRSERPDLVVLDLMLPDKDGLQITRFVRGDDNLKATPIIMLTAKVDDTDKIIGLEIGADDYVTKPFNPRELVARVRAQLRRIELGKESNGDSSVSIIEFGDLKLDLGRHQLFLGEEHIDTTPTEFGLLRILMENPGYAFTRDDLILKVMGYNYAGLGRTLDSHIKNIRKKIELDPKKPIYISTVYGIGYRFEG